MFKGFGKAPELAQDDKQALALDGVIQLLKNGAINAGEKLNRLHIIEPSEQMTNAEGVTWQAVNIPIRWDLLCPGKPNLVGIIAVTAGPDDKMSPEKFASEQAAFVYNLNSKVLLGAVQMSKDLMHCGTVAFDMNTEKFIDKAEGVGEEAFTALKCLAFYYTYKQLKQTIEDADPSVMTEFVKLTADQMGIDPQTLLTI